MAEKLNKVALFIVLLIVIALIFGQLGFTKQTPAGGAQASLTVNGNNMPTAPGAKSTLTIFRTAPVFYGPEGSGYASLTVLPQG
jgi:hypothetical protein